MQQVSLLTPAFWHNLSDDTVLLLHAACCIKQHDYRSAIKECVTCLSHQDLCHQLILLFAAVPIYVQHYLGIPASGTSWQQTLAAAMHSRIRAVQLQSLLPAVVPARHSSPPLLPSVHPSCRLASNSGLSTDASLVTGTSTTGSFALNAQSALYDRGPTHVFEQSLGNALPTTQGQSSAAAGNIASMSPGSAMPNQSREPESVCQTASYADVLKTIGAAKISKRKVAEAEHALQEPQLPVKRHQNGSDQSLSSLQEQTKQLQHLIAQSKAKK